MMVLGEDDDAGDDVWKGIPILVSGPSHIANNNSSTSDSVDVGWSPPLWSSPRSATSANLLAHL